IAAPAVAPPAAAPAPRPEAKPAPKREAPPAPPVVAAVLKPDPAPAAAAVPPVPAADEVVPGMRDLPEPIQRQIPPIAIGGYIYSKNPADRLLLIDKVLRHEGEELAPGLVLEKLQPKAAIFSFKGYRYRVPY
ncbi:general secretion pathway protein GspB, partial [Janthinobacterium sp. AD80]|uniref:general secretion pathway protein GspB n=1 Tax=Janthinobacterium sp. AD80 TaxID=1528773 RepID=UPI0015E0CD81